MIRDGHSKQRTTIFILCIILLIVFIASFYIGRYDVEANNVLKILLSKVFPINQTWDSKMEAVVLNIRLPRILLACLVGCMLSVSGTAYQGIFRNPMASPDLLGASSGAAFGAALAILFHMSNSMITAMAFVSSLISVLIVYIIGTKARGDKAVSFILAGIMIGSIASSLTSFVKLVADPNSELPAITYWLMGSLSGTSNKTLLYILIPMLLGLIPIFIIRWRINILTLGDDEAKTVGVNPLVIRLIVVICSTLITASAVSVSGTIGFVGLVVPHICRRLVGNNYKYLIPASMVAGAIFLLIVDNFSRTLFVTQIPIGILTSFIGAPFFIYLIYRRSNM